MDNLATVEIKAFVPAKDFNLSRRFYTDFGFDEAWTSEDLASFHAGSSSFLLQRFYVSDHAANFMMHLMVENVDAWWRQVEMRQLAQRYGVRAARPENRPWGQRDFTIDDPTGVLWRVAQTIAVPLAG